MRETVSLFETSNVDLAVSLHRAIRERSSRYGWADIKLVGGNSSYRVIVRPIYDNLNTNPGGPAEQYRDQVRSLQEFMEGFLQAHGAL